MITLKDGTTNTCIDRHLRTMRSYQWLRSISTGIEMASSLDIFMQARCCCGSIPLSGCAPAANRVTDVSSCNPVTTPVTVGQYNEQVV